MKTNEEKPQKIPVPTNYRNASKYLRLAMEEKQSIRLFENDRHFRMGRTIMQRIRCNLPQLNAIYERVGFKEKEPRLNEWLARVLISELVYGSGKLNGNSIPVECVRRYESQILDAFKETQSIPGSASTHEPRYVRVNSNVLNLEGAKRLLSEQGWMLVDEEFLTYQSFLDRVKTLTEFEYLVDFHFGDLLVFSHASKKHWTEWAQPEELKSKFFLQNKACLIPTYLLNPPKKSVVMDMCAAPGMKTTHLANLMKNRGRLYAIERDPERYKVLCKFTADFGVVKPLLGDCLSVDESQVPGVQYILLDPSCSGSGMTGTKRLLEPVSEERVYKLAGVQYKLLSHAMNAFPNVHRIVYSTCSLNVTENERVVQGVLRHNGHFKLLDAREELGKEWLNVGSAEFAGIGERCLYARSEIDLTIGMFVAVFERCADGEVNEIFVAHEKQKESYEKVKQMNEERAPGSRRRRQDRRAPKDVAFEDNVPQEEVDQTTKQRQHDSTSPQDNGVENGNEVSTNKLKRKNKEDHEQAEEIVEEIRTTSLQDNNDESGHQDSPTKQKRKKKEKHERAEKIVENILSTSLQNTDAENGHGDCTTKLTRKKKEKHEKIDEVAEEAPSTFSQNNDDENGHEDSTKKLKKKKKQKLERAEEIIEEIPGTFSQDNDNENSQQNSTKKLKRKKQEKQEQAEEKVEEIRCNDDENGYQDSTKKLKRKKKEKLMQAEETVEEIGNNEEKQSKKKLKKKKLAEAGAS